MSSGWYLDEHTKKEQQALYEALSQQALLDPQDHKAIQALLAKESFEQKDWEAHQALLARLSQTDSHPDP